MQIHGIAQKVAFKGIKERANECLDGIALDRGLGREELADRIIPDGGLDERGTRVFDFGPRSFTFVLGPDLKPMVRDATGKRLPDLPKPGAKDDAVVATASVAAWKLLKKQVAEVAKTQSARLELAMIVGRRWTPEEFEKLFLRHPVMVHLVRRLIWGAFDAEGKVARTFRVGDDGTFSDSSDEPTALGEGIAKAQTDFIRSLSTEALPVASAASPVIRSPSKRVRAFPPTASASCSFIVSASTKTSSASSS